jgi:hypothetical protein
VLDRVLLAWFEMKTASSTVDSVAVGWEMEMGMEVSRAGFFGDGRSRTWERLRGLVDEGRHDGEGLHGFKLHP